MNQCTYRMIDRYIDLSVDKKINCGYVEKTEVKTERVIIQYRQRYWNIIMYKYR